MRCGDCLLQRQGFGYHCRCDQGDTNDTDTCHCPDERRAALLAQLGEEDRADLELGKLVRGMPRFESLYRDSDYKWRVYGQMRTPAQHDTPEAALREARGEVTR